MAEVDCAPLMQSAENFDRTRRDLGVGKAAAVRRVPVLSAHNDHNSEATVVPHQISSPVATGHKAKARVYRDEWELNLIQSSRPENHS